MYAQIEWNSKIEDRWGRPYVVGTWMIRRNTPPPHMCYPAEFGRYRSNGK